MYPLPPIAALISMSPRDVGFTVLGHLAASKRLATFVMHDEVRGMSERDYSSIEVRVEAEQILMEGMEFLLRSGFLVQAARNSPPGTWYRLSRAGIEAADDIDFAFNHAPRSMLPIDIMHAEILAEAMPEMDRGPEHFDTAVFKAFRTVEIAVRDAAGFGNEKIGVPLMNAAFGEAGPLRDPEAEKGEAEATRALFAGAIGAFKNPSSHRIVDERDGAQAMRMLAFASLLLQIVDRRLEALGRR
jgi:uncharacterized protein (TIGR02391 family)